MNKIFSWASNPTYENKWDRMVLTKKGAYIAAWVVVDAEKIFTSSIFNTEFEGDAIISQTFPTLEAAKTFANSELKKQGF